MRSAPPLEAWTNWPPSSTIAAHCAATSSLTSRSAPPSPGAAAAGGSPSRASPHSAASASWSMSVFVAMASAVLLDDQLLEENGVDAGGLDRRVDAARQFFLEAIEAGGALEVARAQLAQVGLERIHHARKERLDLRGETLLRQFQHDAHL